SSAGAGPRARSQLPSPPLRRPPAPTLFPYTTLFRSLGVVPGGAGVPQPQRGEPVGVHVLRGALQLRERGDRAAALGRLVVLDLRSEEHTSELQSRFDIVCRLLLEKKSSDQARRAGHQ